MSKTVDRRAFQARTARSQLNISGGLGLTTRRRREGPFRPARVAIRPEYEPVGLRAHAASGVLARSFGRDDEQRRSVSGASATI